MRAKNLVLKNLDCDRRDFEDRLTIFVTCKVKVERFPVASVVEEAFTVAQTF